MAKTNNKRKYTQKHKRTQALTERDQPNVRHARITAHWYALSSANTNRPGEKLSRNGRDCREDHVEYFISHLGFSGEGNHVWRPHTEQKMPTFSRNIMSSCPYYTSTIAHNAHIVSIRTICVSCVQSWRALLEC